MEIIEQGDFEGPEEPRVKMLAIAEKCDEVVIAKVQNITDWWLLRHQKETVGYFGTAETFKTWRRGQVN